MTNNLKYPNYNEITLAFNTLKITHSASEIYGLLCALLIASADLTEQAWVNSLINKKISKSTSDKQAYTTLVDFFNWTKNYLYQNNNSIDDFYILMPDTKKEFNHALSELILFSQGFLSGLNLAHINSKTQEDSDIKDALEAITQVACLEHDLEKNSNSNQESLEICINYIKDATVFIINKLIPTLNLNTD